LLITILSIIIKPFLHFTPHSSNYRITNPYHSNLTGFSQPFTQPYLTIHPIPSIPFSIILLNPIKTTPIHHPHKIFKHTIIPPLIPPIPLLFIYISLAYIGNHINIPS
ncbi:branched-chain amino acid transport system II carrier protein, partial [Staphylococcus epidermidis]|uniref:branched-chain amino acid transport system II carrier protein n=1 Tax=Staphylococcus epidermidis TaxID=1282 RepID=UPI0016426854